MKNVLVTDEAGCVGNVLMPVLLDSGYNVTVYDELYFGGDTLPNGPPKLAVYLLPMKYRLIRRDLGWSPTVAFGDGIGRMLADTHAWEGLPFGIPTRSSALPLHGLRH